MGLIALLATVMAFAALGCGGQKPAEESTTTESAPMEEHTMSDTGMGAPDSMVSDTGAAH
jgi:hypothetical protein